MAEKVLKKVNARLKFLFRIKNYLNKRTKQMLVWALIQCHYDYSCCFWFSALPKNMKEKLNVSQRKAIRFVLDKDSMNHLEFNDFKNAGFLPLDYRVMLLKANHMYKILTIQLHNICWIILLKSHQFSTQEVVKTTLKNYFITVVARKLLNVQVQISRISFQMQSNYVIISVVLKTKPKNAFGRSSEKAVKVNLYINM